MTTATLSRPAPPTAPPTARRLPLTQASLFAQGYRCALRGPALLVRNPEGREYLVTASGCTCQATTESCRHRLGAERLAMQQAEAHALRAVALEIEAEQHKACTHFASDGEERAWGFTEIGLDLRARAVRMFDRADALYAWAESREREVRLVGRGQGATV
jgi:hypothetical protein